MSERPEVVKEIIVDEVHDDGDKIFVRLLLDDREFIGELSLKEVHNDE